MNTPGQLNLGQLKEESRLLIERSRSLMERSVRPYTSSAEQAAQLVCLDERCRAALADAQRLQSSLPTGWLPPS